MTFDPAVVSFEQLLAEFWRHHDPTTPNRQGPDRGTQYRSAVFTRNEEQAEGGQRLIGGVPEPVPAVPS